MDNWIGQISTCVSFYIINKALGAGHLQCVKILHEKIDISGICGELIEKISNYDSHVLQWMTQTFSDMFNNIGPINVPLKSGIFVPVKESVHCFIEDNIYELDSRTITALNQVHKYDLSQILYGAYASYNHSIISILESCDVFTELDVQESNLYINYHLDVDVNKNIKSSRKS